MLFNKEITSQNKCNNLIKIIITGILWWSIPVLSILCIIFSHNQTIIVILTLMIIGFHYVCTDIIVRDIVRLHQYIQEKIKYE